MKKRIVAFLTCALLMLSSAMGISAGADGTVSDSDAAHLGYVANLMTELEIFTDFGGTCFELGKVLTKAEMCVLVSRITGVNASSGMYYGTDVFDDVPASHWAASSINLMKELGVVSGNGSERFFPENNVTQSEAVKMFVSALGYDVVAKSRGGYPSGYVTVANELGLLEGVSLKSDVTYSDIVLMTYNAFEVPLVRAIGIDDEIYYSVDKSNCDTILSIRGIYYGEGQVTANEYSSLVPGLGACAEKRVIIGDATYKCASSGIADALGHNVEFYYKSKNSGDEIITYTITDEKTVTISAENIVNLTLDYIEYYDENENVKKAKISHGAAFIYNGVADTISTSLMNITSGTITLWGSGSSGYDIVSVKSYVNMIVDSVSADDIIYFQNGEAFGNTFIDASEAQIIKNGEVTSPSALVQGDAVAIRKSLDSSLLIIETLPHAKYGEVTEIEGTDRVSVDSESYEISPEFSSYNNAVLAPGVGGTFYVDKSGRVFYFIESEPGVKYAFPFGIKKEGIDNNVRIKALISDSSYPVFELAKSIEIANFGNVKGKTVKMTEDDAYAYLKTELVDTLFVYETNASGEIDYIEFPSNGDTIGDIEGFSLDYILDVNTRSGYGRIGKTHVNAFTTQFIICKNGDNYDEKNSYVTIGVGDYSSGAYFGDPSDPVYFYDISRAGVAGALLDFISSKASSLSGSEWPVLLVDEVAASLNEEGDEQLILKGIFNGSYSKWFVSEDAGAADGLIENITDVKTGDLMFINRNKAGEISTFRVIYDSDNPKEGVLASAGSGYAAVYASDTTVFSGYIYHLDNNNLRLCYDGSSYITFSTSKAYSVYVYDSKRDKIYVGDKSDIIYSELNDCTQNSKIILRANRNDINTIIVYK